MKRNVLTLHFLLAVFCATFFLSCKKDKDNLLSGRPADLLELIKQSTHNNSGGFIHMVEEIASVASASQLSCGQPADTTLTRNSSLSLTPYAYSVLVRRQLVCQSGALSNLDFPVHGIHGFETLRLRMEGDVEMANIIDNLGTGENNWHFSTRYRLNGPVTSKFTDKVFNHVILLSSDNLLIEKTSSKITSGTAAMEIQYQEGGEPVNVYTANITFHGRNRATIQFEGNNYQLHW